MIFSKTRKILHGIRVHLQDQDLRWIAGSLAFSTVLSIVPFFALTLTVLQYLGGPEVLEPSVQKILLQYFQQALGSEASQLLKTTLANLRLEAIGVTSLIFLIVTSLRLLQDIEYGIARMWAKKRRPLLNRILIAWLLLFSFTFFLAVYAGFRSLDFVRPFIRFHKGIMDFFIFSGGLFMLYKFLPPVPVRTKSATIAAILGSLAMSALQGSFAWIAKSFFNISKIYGSIATVPLLLTWVLILWYVVLTGAALAANLDKYDRSALH